MYKTIAALAFAGLAFAQHDGAGQSPDSKPAEQVYKNIIELKGTPADQIGPAMQFISASLGVTCDFCHVQGRFDADDKGPKKTAREMIAMQNMINKNAFHGRTQVTCNTCHRGSARPVAVPPVLESEAGPMHPAISAMPAPVAGASAPTADQILEKWVAASGGADALHKITSRDMKGNILVGANQSPIELLAKAPNKRVSISQMGGNQSFTAFDGTAGWLGTAGRPARDMSAAESAASSIDAAFYLPLQLKEMYPQLRRGRPETVNGAECEVLNGSAPGKPAVRLYFDKSTGLLVRQVRYADTPLGRNPTQIDYADYKPVDGVTIPLRWTLARPNGRFTIQITDVKSNAPIDDSRFAKPAGEVK
jgi:photosynthetic reaction center cytochrome c subunit